MNTEEKLPSVDDEADEAGKLLARTLESTGLIEIVEVNVSVGMVSVLGRVTKSNEARYLDQIIDPALSVIDQYEGFAGRQYFRKSNLPQGKRLRYGWVISLSAQNIMAATKELCEIIENSRTVMDVMESPLMGPPAPQSGGVRTGRKGASATR